MTYIANELAFDDTAAAHLFLHRWNAATYVSAPPPPAPTVKPISITLNKTPKIAKFRNTATAMQVDDKPEENEEDTRVLECKAAHTPLVAASQTFNKVDIKVSFLGHTRLKRAERMHYVGSNLIAIHAWCAGCNSEDYP